ncbi:MAG: sigma-70 family RNA polymerase sigma factor [Planctomycetes bacterium]|nr:sigma-70 family RNA polymerase sigma factor [Planctomycetota bacterium]
MAPRDHVRPEDLLAHAGWMRALAGALLADPGAADDVVQQAWVAAWRRPPASDQPIEPWLARVVRNFASKRRRGDTRRAAHEARAPQPGPPPAPERTLEQLELQRVLVDAVAQLEEPLRTTLVQRWFEGRSSVEIAQLLGVPEGTVRWRLKRGLEELRTRLDRRYGDRAAWGIVFAPFAAPLDPAAASVSAASLSSSAAPAATGVVLMGATLKFAAVALVVAAASVWWMWGEPTRGDAAARPRGAASPSVAPAAEVADLDAPAVQRAALDTPGAADAASHNVELAATPSAAELAPSVPPGNVQVRFVDSAGVPWAGVLVECESNGVLHGARSGEDGRVALEVPLHSRDSQRTARLDAHRRGLGSVRVVTAVRSGETTHLGDVVLGPGAQLRGRVLDARGAPLASARVGLLPAAFELRDPDGLRRNGDDGFELQPDVTSDADGRFVFEGVGAGSWRVWAHAEGLRYGWSELFESAPPLELELPDLVLTEFEARDRIAGRVLDPRGEPLADVRVHVGYVSSNVEGKRSLTSGPDGRFELIVASDAVYRFIVLAPDGTLGAAHVDGVQPGTLDLVLQLNEPRWIELDVKASDGTRPSGTQVKVIDPRYLYFDEKNARGVPHEGRVRVAEPAYTFQLEVAAPDFQTVWLGPYEPGAAPSSFDVVLQPLPRLRGVVRSSNGPVGGASIQPLSALEEGTIELNTFFVRMMRSSIRESTTDAGGSFVLEGSGDVWLRVTADGFAPALVGPFTIGASSAPVEIELGRGGAIEGRVVRADGSAAEGAIVGLSCGDGFGFTLRAGPGGLYRAEGLTPGQWQVLPRSEELRPESSTLRQSDGGARIEWSCQVREGEVTRFDVQLP